MPHAIVQGKQSFEKRLRHDARLNDLCFFQETSEKPTGHDSKLSKGPLIPRPVPLPPALAKFAKPVEPQQMDIAAEQAAMRKRKKEEQKAAIAAKEAEKNEKQKAKVEKEQEMQAKRAERERKKAEKEAKRQEKEEMKKSKRESMPKPSVAAGSNETEKAADMKKPSRKGKNAEKEDGKARKPRKNGIMETPCKIWDPHGRKTPKKVLERRKRESKAQSALAKLRRNRELLPDMLADLEEPKDEGKLNLILTFSNNKLVHTCAKTKGEV